MEFNNKFEVLWEVERNIDMIFESVIGKFVKNIIPDADKNFVGDLNASSTVKTLLEVENFEEFVNKYGNKNNSYAEFIIQLTENIHDLNMFKYESMDEAECVLEANKNPDLVHQDLVPALDDELMQFELTKNMKDEIAGVIKDDLERAAEEAANDEKIKNDLDDIEADSDEEKKDKVESEVNEDDEKLSDEDMPDPDEETEEAIKECFDIVEAYGEVNKDLVKFILSKQDGLKPEDLDKICKTYIKLKDEAKTTKFKLMLGAMINSIKTDVSDAINRKSKDDRYLEQDEIIEIVELTMSRKLGGYAKPVFDYIYDDFEATLITVAVTVVCTLILGTLGVLISYGVAIVLSYKMLITLVRGLGRVRGILKDSIRSIDKNIEELEASKGNPKRLEELKEIRAQLAKNSGLKEFEIYSISEAHEIMDAAAKPKYKIKVADVTQKIVEQLSLTNNVKDADATEISRSISVVMSSILMVEMMDFKTQEEMKAILEI